MHLKQNLLAFFKRYFTSSKTATKTLKNNENNNIDIPKLTLKQLNRKELKLYNNLNTDNYGKEIANQVAEKLMGDACRGGLYYAHRDYCGLGIFIHDNTFVLSTVNDGYGVCKIILSFASKTDFINWLSQENDQSMALYGEKFNNQTITRSRIHWFLKDNYSPVWNDYYLYLKSLSN